MSGHHIGVCTQIQKKPRAMFIHCMGHSPNLAVQDTVFMLIECMIQLPQENLVPGIACILLERKPLPAVIFHESN